MCCFSRAVRHVSGTQIFARGTGGGRQALVYQMKVEIPEDLAMVLPLPVLPGPGDDAVTFVSLEGYPELFTDLDKAFPGMVQAAARGFGPPTRAPLVVHDVGAFEASFVPTRGDFARLDPRFRLPDDVWDSLPHYADWGFAVFKLRPPRGLLGAQSRVQAVHPMALTFPSREPDALFFPTVHVHDGTAPDVATFDHTLACQPDGLLSELLGWSASAGHLDEHVSVERSQGLLAANRGGFRAWVAGALPNEDVWLRAPADLSREALTPAGEPFRARVRCTFAYQPVAAGAPPHFARWRRTAQRDVTRVAHALAEGLRALTAAHAERWALAPWTEELAPHFINGSELWRGSSYMDGQRGHAGGPGRVAFRPFSDDVEPQDVSLAFRTLPDATLVHEIIAALRLLLERAVQAGASRADDAAPRS